MKASHPELYGVKGRYFKQAPARRAGNLIVDAGEHRCIRIWTVRESGIQLHTDDISWQRTILSPSAATVCELCSIRV